MPVLPPISKLLPDPAPPPTIDPAKLQMIREAMLAQLARPQFAAPPPAALMGRPPGLLGSPPLNTAIPQLPSNNPGYPSNLPTPIRPRTPF